MARRPAAPGARVGVVEDVATFYGDDGVERIRVRCFPRDATVEVLSADGKRVRVARRATEDDPPFADVLRAAARGGGVATFGGLTCRLTSWDAAATRDGAAAPRRKRLRRCAPPAPLDAGDEKTLRFRGHLADAAGAGAAVAPGATTHAESSTASRTSSSRARGTRVRGRRPTRRRVGRRRRRGRGRRAPRPARGGAVRTRARQLDGYGRRRGRVRCRHGGGARAACGATGTPPVATLNGEPADAAAARADAEAVAVRLVGDGGGGADAARCLARLALRLRDARVNVRALARTTGLLAAAAADGVVSHDRFVAFVACDLERAIEAAARRRRVAAAAADAATALAAARRRDDGETEAAAVAVVARARRRGAGSRRRRA